MKFNKEFPIVILIAALSRIPLLLKTKVLMWDAAVYLMNAKWFAGQKIFWESLRAPFLPFLLSFLFKIGINNETAFRIVSITFAIASIMLTYLLAKELFGKKTAFLSATILSVIPIHVFWSPMIYTEIPSSVFLLASLYFLWKGLKNEKMIYISIFTSGLAFLTRYPLGILFPAIMLFLLLNKKLNLKKIFLYATIFLLTISPWLIYNYSTFGDPMHSFKEGIRWQGPTHQPIYFYLTTLPNYASFVSIIIIAGGVYSLQFFKKQKFQLLLIFLIMFIGFLTVSGHKEERYILPAIPLIVIFSSYFIEKIDIKKWIPIIGAIIVLTAAASLQLQFPSCDGIINASKDLDGVVASTYWPLTAYYGNVKVRAMPADLNEFDSFLREGNITYVITSSKGEWPPYAQNFSFFDNNPNLEVVKGITDKCQIYKVYKVKL
ncbi:MAG: glycosyltransferase family 39 protein [Nanoarchaeota archaeon]|nr:glycosyltransferase family 39 protein [Nanoarchaeota archaeon]